MPKFFQKISATIFTATILWAAAATAQKLHFEKLSSELGLSQNMINCLVQDKKGFLWVGTKDGLNRFDGYRFTTFRYDPFDSLSLSGNQIFSILEDRHGRFWVATDKGINFFDREKEIFQHLETPTSKHKLVEDPWGNIWQGGYQNGLLRLDLLPDEPLERAKITFHQVPESSEKYFLNPVWDAAGRGFVSKIGRAAYRIRYDSLRQEFSLDRRFDDLRLPAEHPVVSDFEKKDSSSEVFTARFLPGREGKIWMSNSQILFCWDGRGAGNVRQIAVPDSFQFEKNTGNNRWQFFTTAIEDRRARLWLGGFWGTFRVDLTTSEVICLSPKSSEVGNPLTYGVSSGVEDESGLIWLGTRGNGLLKFDDNARRFSNGRWRGQSIRSLFKTSDGRVWLSPVDGGLFFLDEKRQKMGRLDDEQTRFFNQDIGTCTGFYESKNGTLWLGSGNWGLVKIRGWQVGNKPQIEVFRTKLTRTWQGHYAPTSILEASDGSIWMTCPDALRHFDPLSQQFESFPFFGEYSFVEFENNLFPTVFQDRRGRIWVGMNGKGLWLFDLSSKISTQATAEPIFKKYQNDRQNPQSLSHDLVKCIAEDPSQPERFLWIGTGGGGLNRFDMDAGTFEKFTEKDGLPDLTIYGIQPDAAGNLWLSTNKGLSVFDPKTRVFRNFDQRDGLQNLEFNTLAHSKSADGELLFGGIEGFNAFYPEKMLQANRHVPQVVFTDFKISGKSVSHKAADSPLDVAIAYARRIVLPPDAKVISFEFAALDFADPSKNQFSCKMEGFDRDWQPLGTAHSATYTNLSPGKYTFRVRGTNNDGIWCEADASLEIEVLAPWWTTWWAYFLYFLTVSAVVFAFFRLQIKRNQAHAETRRLQELNEAKSQFLSTVSHELRTPLTSIMGFSKIIKKRLEERILPKTDLSDSKTGRAAEQVLENLNIVVSESERLTALINEVLDLAKIESGKVAWHEEKLEISEIIERAAAATITIFENKNLKLQIKIAPDLPQILGDPDRLLQVLVNLLSNAAKFTEQGGVTVSIRLSDPHTILIGVLDTGIGIPKEFQALVFEKFRQVTSDTLTDKPQGTGLGLPICKEIVEHHSGRIWLESEVGEGAAFWFTLPVR